MPPFCAYCKVFLAHDTVLCLACVARIRPVLTKQIPITKKYTLTVHALGVYKDPLTTLIIAKSWSDISAARQLGQLLASSSAVQHVEIDALIPVPLHWWREARRGYNQAEVIAQAIAQSRKCPVLTPIKRITYRPFQAQVPFAHRAANVADSFKLSGSDLAWYRNKHLVIIDDVLTSGATLEAMARELIKLKPASIRALVAARAL